MSLSAEKKAELQKIAKKLRYDIVLMIGSGKPGHLGGSCSIADIVAVLYFHKMRHKPENPKWPDRDRFLLSKGHAAPIFYTVLANAGAVRGVVRVGLLRQEGISDAQGTRYDPPRPS